VRDEWLPLASESLRHNITPATNSTAAAIAATTAVPTAGTSALAADAGQRNQRCKVEEETPATTPSTIYLCDLEDDDEVTMACINRVEQACVTLEGLGNDTLGIIVNIVLPLNIDLTVHQIESGSQSDALACTDMQGAVGAAHSDISRRQKALHEVAPLFRVADWQVAASPHAPARVVGWRATVLRIASNTGTQDLPPIKKEDLGGFMVHSSNY
jgi:hypothetical protein